MPVFLYAFAQRPLPIYNNLQAKNGGAGYAGPRRILIFVVF
jgi:hypothetical protein